MTVFLSAIDIKASVIRLIMRHKKNDRRVEIYVGGEEFYLTPEMTALDVRKRINDIPLKGTLKIVDDKNLLVMCHYKTK